MSIKYVNKLHFIAITMTKYIVSHDDEDDECLFVSFAVEHLCSGEISIKMPHGMCVNLLVQMVKQNKKKTFETLKIQFTIFGQGGLRNTRGFIKNNGIK